MSTNGVNFDVSLLSTNQQKKLQKATTEQEKINIFKQELGDTKLSKEENTSLQTKYGLTAEGIKQIKKMPGGEAFLNQLAYAHLETAGDNATFKGAEKLGEADVKTKLATFLVDANGLKTLDDISKIPAATLTEVGLIADDLTKVLTPRLQQEAGMVAAEFPANAAAGETAAKKVNIIPVQAEDGTKSIKVFNDTTAVSADNPDETLTFDAETGRYIRAPKEEGGASTYFALKETKDEAGNVTSRQLVDETVAVNQTKGQIEQLSGQFTSVEFAAFADEIAGKTDAETAQILQGKLQEKQNGIITGLREQAAQLGATVPEDLGEGFEAQQAALNGIIQKQTTINRNRAAFTPEQGKRVITGATVDESTSKQRLRAAKQWDTNIAVSQKAEFDPETGFPNRISISLGVSYGYQGGTKEERLTLRYDAKDGVYRDPQRLREFTPVVGDDGKVTLTVKADDGRIKQTVDQGKAIAAQMQAEHNAFVATHGAEGAQGLNGSTVAWYNMKGAYAADRQKVAYEGIAANVDTSEIAGYGEMTPAQQREAVVNTYIAAHNTANPDSAITVPTDEAGKAALAGQIATAETELNGMHDYGKVYASTGDTNLDAIMLHRAQVRKSYIEQQNEVFTTVPDGGQSPQAKLQAATTVASDSVKKDGDGNPEVLYDPATGREQTVEMTAGGNITVAMDENGAPTSFARGDVSIDAQGNVTIGDANFEPVGAVYEALYGADATGPKGLADVIPTIEAGVGEDFKFAPATEEQLAASNAEVATRAQAAIAAGYPLTADDAGDVAKLLEAEQNIATNNAKYADVKDGIAASTTILAKAVETGVATDATTGVKQVSHLEDERQRIDLADGSRIYVTFNDSNQISRISTLNAESQDGYCELTVYNSDVVYNPEEADGQNDENNNRIIMRYGNAQSIITLEQAIAYVNALATANGFKIQTKAEAEEEERQRQAQSQQ